MKVFIGGIVKTIPQFYTYQDFVSLICPEKKVGEKLHKTVLRLAKSIGIKQRPIARDLNKPEKNVLKKAEYHPLNWGKEVIKSFANQVGIENIGFLSVSYNASYHTEIFPNLASRIVLETGLYLEKYPEEIPFYGCASGLFSLKSAYEYCKLYKKASVVFTFDQCSKLGRMIYNTKDPLFKKIIKTLLLFSDGGVGLLIIPEDMAEKFDGKLIEIKDILLSHQPGGKIRTEEGFFLIDNDLKEDIPPIVCKKVIKPILERNSLTVSDIEEWALHQGGFAILEKFTEKGMLGLTNEQIKRSWELLENYGNMSSPSCLLVLDSFFHENKEKKGKKGMIVGFGAGYYMGSALYQWA